MLHFTNDIPVSPKNPKAFDLLGQFYSVWFQAIRSGQCRSSTCASWCSISGFKKTFSENVLLIQKQSSLNFSTVKKHLFLNKTDSLKIRIISFVKEFIRDLIL